MLNRNLIQVSGTTYRCVEDKLMYRLPVGWPSEVRVSYDTLCRLVVRGDVVML